MKKYNVYKDDADADTTWNTIGYLIEHRDNKYHILYDWWWLPGENTTVGISLYKVGYNFGDMAIEDDRSYIKTDIEFDTKEEFLDWITEKYFIEML